jgi:tetratricopeptide (TPR) repeat protein
MYQEYEKGLQLYEDGQYQEAEQAFLKSIDEHPAHALSFNKLGLICIKTGRYTLAKEYFSEAIKLDPQLVSSWNNMGNIALQENKLEEARTCYSKALEVEPDNPILRRNLSRVEKQLRISPLRIFCKLWEK